MSKKETLNPYRFSVYQIFNRLLWDLNPKSYFERKKIRILKNKYYGKKAIIMCNGPSLNKVNYDLIEKSDCFVFGLNKINLLFKKTSLRPNFIVATNMHVISQNADFYNNTDIELFIDSKALKKRLLKKNLNINYIHSALIPGFAKDCSISINPSHTVTNTALQIAYHMGFTKIAIVGADHEFFVKGPANSYISGIEEDNSHFDKSYFANVEWQLPDLVESEVGYLRAKNCFESDNREIFNCTEGGKLEIFKRLDLSDFLATI